jgi:diguanylate cyclase (GGDEF)-like protein
MLGKATLSWLRLRPNEPEIVIAQIKELRRQIPLLYALLTVNAIAVAYTHYEVAPYALTVLVPAALVGMSAIRFIVWIRRQDAEISAQVATVELRRTVLIGAALGIAYVTWSLSLGGYGGPYEQGHVALFIAATVIGCIFCLMHAPQAALVVTAVVTIPYLIYYLSIGNSVFSAIALNIALVTAVMLQVLLNSFRAFSAAVRAQTALALKNAEAELLSADNLRLAHTDALTGLPNRRYFFSYIDAEISRLHGSSSGFILGVLDLDRFKAVNDSYGHIVGDRLLSEVGSILRSCTEEDAVVARLGGDEFAFLVRADTDAATSFGQSICDRLSKPFELDGRSITIGCSCGMAEYPLAGQSSHELFDRADYALYTSKSEREGRAIAYSSEHERQIKSERAIEAALRAGTVTEEIDVFFQPIVETPTGKTVAVEALARWNSRVLGPIRPDVFIPIAERSGQMHAFTLMLFEKALHYFHLMPNDLKLSFNLSAHDLTSPQTVLALVTMIERSMIAPSRIILEITETAVMRDFEAAEQSIAWLRRLGTRIALDDFGSGQSSLGYLHRLKIDKVKTDRSFIAGLEEEWGRKIIASIIGLCENLDLCCVIEGVENETQLSVLKDLGCTTFQGYYFAKPMAFAEMLEYLHGIQHQIVPTSSEPQKIA